MDGARRYAAVCRAGLSRASLHRYPAKTFFWMTCRSIKKWGELKEPAQLEVEGGSVKLYLRGHLQHDIPISEVLPLHDPNRPYRCYALHAPTSRDANGEEAHYAVCLASRADGEAFLQRLSKPIDPPSSLVLLRSLSDELLLHIFSFLSPADLLRAAQVCLQWNILSSDHTLWRRAYVRAFSAAKAEPGLRWKEQFLRHAHWRRPRSGSSYSNEDGHHRPTRIIKLVAVGDSVGSEKTALLMAYAHDQFPEDYVPTVFENNVVSLQVGDFNVELHLWDTTGAEQYDRLRPLSYANANVFLLVFSVVEPASFDNILNKWSPELYRFCPRIPKLLVGTQIEKRSDPATLARLQAQGKRPIEAAEAEAVLPQLRASSYLECSARTGQNRDQVFLEAVKAVLLQKRDSKCTLL